MGSCFSRDETLNYVLDDLDWGTLNFSQFEYEAQEDGLLNDSSFAPCHSTYCPTFFSVIPIFLILASLLGLLSNGFLLVVLALRPWPRGKTGIILITVLALVFALMLPFPGAGILWGWSFGSNFCQVSHGLKSGCIFAQGLVVAGGAGQMPRAVLGVLFSLFLLAMGMLLGIPAALLSLEEGTICVLRQEPMSLVLGHAIICLSIFVILPVLVGLAKMVLKGQGSSKNLGIDITWIFYLFWAPYGIAVFLNMLLKEHLLPLSCGLQEDLDFFLGISEGLAILHCFLFPLGLFFCSQKST